MWVFMHVFVCVFVVMCACTCTCMVAHVCCVHACVCMCLCVFVCVCVCDGGRAWVQDPREPGLHGRQSSRGIRKNATQLGILVRSLKTGADVPLKRWVGAFAKCSQPYVHFLKLPMSPWPFWQMPHFPFKMKTEISLETQGLNRLIGLNKSPHQVCSSSVPHRNHK